MKNKWIIDGGIYNLYKHSYVKSFDYRRITRPFRIRPRPLPVQQATRMQQ